MPSLSWRLAIAREVRCNEGAFRVLLKALGNSFQGSERFLFGNVSNTVSVRGVVLAAGKYSENSFREIILLFLSDLTRPTI
jgi:hypothetical protein